MTHFELGHIWHSAQCTTPETGEHWSARNLREFSIPNALRQTYWSWTNAVKKLDQPPCAFDLMCFLCAAVEGWVMQMNMEPIHKAEEQTSQQSSGPSHVWRRVRTLKYKSVSFTLEPFGLCTMIIWVTFSTASRVSEEALRRGTFQWSDIAWHCIMTSTLFSCCSFRDLHQYKVCDPPEIR